MGRHFLSGFHMNHPSDSSSSGADSDSGFDFVPPPSAAARKPAGLPTPKPSKTKSVASAAPRRKSNATPRRSAAPTIEIQTEGGVNEDQTVADRLHRKRSQLSSFFTSSILHIVILLVLGLWAIDRKPESTIGLTGQLDMSDVTESIVEPSPIKFETPEVAESPIENIADETSTDLVEMASSEVPTIVDALPEKEAVADSVEPTSVAPAKTLPTGGGLAGRDAESRAKLAAKFGGSQGSEAAVELGLQWIIKHQLTDGSWRLRHCKSDCDGRCGNEGTVDSPTAATGLALMSLLGAGYTHEKGPYRAQVFQGLNFLEREIRYLPYGGSLGGSGAQPMYSHAIATIALAEALAMTGDETYRKPVTEAYRYIVEAQHKKGGWKYRPQMHGDMSVTGWMLMAMKACENAGVEPNMKSRKLVQQFIDSLAFGDGIEYGYEETGSGDIKPAEGERKPSCTAIGHLMQMYLGREREHPMLAVACQQLAKAGSSDSDVYFNYYTTLVLHHARASQWKEWNQTVRDHLIRSQQTHGHEAGSWFFPDKHGRVGGRLYTTAMAIMTLEVYYRFMPLYKTEAGEGR